MANTNFNPFQLIRKLPVRPSTRSSEQNPTEIPRLRFSQRQARLIRRVGIQSGALGFVAGALVALVVAWGYANV